MARNFLEYDYSNNTVIDIFNDIVNKSGDKVFLRQRGDNGWVDLTWNEIASRVEAISSFLINSGLQKGGMVAIYAANRPEWIITDLAALTIACTDAAIYHETPSQDIAYILNDSKTEICFCDGKQQADNILLRKRELPNLKKIVVFDDPGPGYNDEMVITFDEALKEGAANSMKPEFRERRKAVKGSDIMTVIYMPSVTGQPKGVMLSHSNVMFTLIKYNMRQNLPEGHSALSLLPLSCAQERILGYYSTLLDRGSIAFSRGINFLKQDFAEIKPNLSVLSPFYAEKLYGIITGITRKAPPFKQRLFSGASEAITHAASCFMNARPLPFSLRIKYLLYNRLIFSRLRALTGLSRRPVLIVTGSSLLPKIHDFFWGMKIQIRKCYGLAETTAVLNLDGDPELLQVKSDNWITPFPETEIKTTVDGEILVKGPQIMAGYLNRPQETQDMYTPDGWFKTADIGITDVQGYINLTDRKSDILITSTGKKISPLLVESALRYHPMISQAAVFGESRKHVAALIVPDFENLESWAEQNNIGFTSAKGLVENSQVIQKYYKIVDKINREMEFTEPVKELKLLPEEFSFARGELTPAMKIKRRIISDLYRKKIDALFAE